MNCLALIQQRYSSMSPVEKKIASCILADPQGTINGTISRLASDAGTAVSSVAYFANSLGFKGYSDMKIQLAQSLGTNSRIIIDQVTVRDDPKTAMQKLAAEAAASFNSTIAAITDELSRAAELIQNARKIEVYGAGSSLPIAYDVHYRLMRLGLSAQILPDPLLACISSSQLCERDAVIAISHKGRTTNTLTAVEIAKKHGAKVIALTSFASSPLSDMSDVCLVAISGEAQAYREAVISRLTQLLIVDSLCSYIAVQRGMDAMQHLDNEMELLELHRQKD